MDRVIPFTHKKEVAIYLLTENRNLAKFDSKCDRALTTR